MRQDAYIVAATRTPVGKAPRGMSRATRHDDLLRHVLGAVLDSLPGLARLPDPVPGVTVSRFCASGLDAVALAANRIRLGDDTHGHAAAWSAPQEAAIWHGHHVHRHGHGHGRGRDI